MASHWKFWSLPPFFTLQPAPIAQERQLNLWCDCVWDVVSRSSHALARPGHCEPLGKRISSSSASLFENRALRRQLPAAGISLVVERLALDRERALTIDVAASDGAADDEAIIALAVPVEALEAAVVEWVLDHGVGTTLTKLTQDGAVLTLQELEASLRFRPLIAAPPPAPPAEVPDYLVAACATTDAEVLHSLLSAAEARGPSANARGFGSLRVALFNLDGSDRRPFEGVKIGGIEA